MTNKLGLGPQALRILADLWRCDGPLTQWRDDGFDWWPGDFGVSVKILRRLEQFGPETWQLSVQTDVLKDIPIDDPDFATRVGLISSLPTTYALFYPIPDFWKQHAPAGTLPYLRFSNTVYVTSENIAWMPNFLGRMAIMQPINAQLQSATTAPLFPGSSPAKARPKSLADAALDPMLEVASQAYAPVGQEANQWLGTDEFSSIAAGWNSSSEYCHAIGDESGLSLETSFGDETALIRLWTDQRSLQLGNGLTATLELPYFADQKTIAEECAGLNFIETLWTDVPQFGSWSPCPVGNDQYCLACALFIPNSLYGPGIASHAVYWMLQKARRFRQARCPDVMDKPVHEIFEERLHNLMAMPDQVRQQFLK